MAVLDALIDVKLISDDINCIIGTSGSMEQSIPSNVVLIQEKLGLGNLRIA